jgi:hypothetical protein
MAMVVGEESEQQMMETEAKAKEAAEAAAREPLPPPPPFLTQQDFAQYMRMADERQRILIECQMKMMQDVMDHDREGRNEGVHGVSLADFLNTRPLPFALAPEPMDVEDWLLDTERKCNTVDCNDSEKLRYATHLLCGPAAAWWDNIVAIHPPGRVFTWDEFKRKFREANVPESIMELKRMEFDNLTKKDKTIMKYVKEFTLLSRYATDAVNTDEKRKKRFMRGLHPMAKMQLRMLKAADFQELVDVAITMEDDFKQVQEEHRKKAKLEPRRYPVNKPTADLSFKPRSPSRGMLPRGGGGNPRNLIICHSCGAKGHYSNECQKPKVVCYGCNQEGHMKNQCPNKAAWGKKSSGRGPNRGDNSGGNGIGKRSRPFGKLNCTNLEEVDGSDKTMIGTLQILSHPGKVLFDTGATTPFISQEFIDLYGIPCNKLEY